MKYLTSDLPVFHHIVAAAAMATIIFGIVKAKNCSSKFRSKTSTVLVLCLLPYLLERSLVSTLSFPLCNKNLNSFLVGVGKLYEEIRYVILHGCSLREREIMLNYTLRQIRSE